MPDSAEAYFAMQELSGMWYNTNEQPKDSCKSVRQPDVKNTFSVISVIKEWNHISMEPILQYISIGVTAHDKS